jgi:hypothetical protein
MCFEENARKLLEMTMTKPYMIESHFSQATMKNSSKFLFYVGVGFVGEKSYSKHDPQP